MSDEAKNTPDNLLTRSQVAERLGISTSSVRRLEWKQLHPDVDEHGIHRFDPAEVDALPKTRRSAPARRVAPMSSEQRALSRKGRLAAEVFRMFGRRMTLQQIVVATRQSPEVIRDLYREWATSLEDAEFRRRCGAFGP
jgi:hypothetical protein